MALTADSGKNAGPCLTPASMTAFLDGSCSSAEKEAALRHISLCQRCYGEWLVLAELQMESDRKYQKKERRPFFLRPANLAAIASAMAAMVCIGLFLDINPFTYRIDKQTVPPVATMKGKLPKAPAASAPALQNQVATDSAALPAPAQLKEKLEEQQSTIPQKKMSTADHENKTTSSEKVVKRQAAVKPDTVTPSQPPPTPAEKPAASPLLQPNAEQAAGAAAPLEMRIHEEIHHQAPSPGSFLQWQQELIAVCREKDPEKLNKDRLHHLFSAGKKALPIWRHEQLPSSADQSLQLLLLRILDQAQSEEQVLKGCQEILTEVERERR